MGTMGGLLETRIILGRNNPHKPEGLCGALDPSGLKKLQIPPVGRDDKSTLTMGCRTELGNWRCPCRSLRLRSR